MKIFIDKDWINGKIDAIVTGIPNQFDAIAVKNALREIRTPFVEKLKAQGYNVFTENEKIDDDTICCIMNWQSINKDINTKEYTNIMREKIANAAGPHFHFPYSVTLEEYFAKPFFPAVFKNELENGGVDKFLINTPEQVEIIKNYYEQNKDNAKIMDKFELCIVQQLIETPTRYATYMRVLANGAGESMGANLKCARSDFEKSNLKSFIEKIFFDPNSEYFLNTTKMFNYYSGGLEIGLSQPKYSRDKEEILIEHGFDMNNLKLPEEVSEVVKNIMLKCNQEVSVMCGLDFMLNKADNHWYYLENQAFPAIEEWAKPKDITIPGNHTLKGYIRYHEIELQAREEALMATINYRQTKDGENRKLTMKPPKENN